MGLYNDAPRKPTRADNRCRTSDGLRQFAVHQRPGVGNRFGSPARVGVYESRLTHVGAHVRIYEGSEAVQLSVAEAKLVRDALGQFIEEAEAGELVEPASWDDPVEVADESP